MISLLGFDWNTLWVNGGLIALKFVLTLVVGIIIIKVLAKILEKVLQKTKIDALGRKFIIRSIKIILYFVLIMALISVIGIPITGVIAAFSAVGLAIALALQNSLSSLANGVILIFTKPFKKNDLIRINGVYGKVDEINLFNTVINTLDNKRMIIPNRDMLNYTIENTNANSMRRVSVTFSVAYDTDVKKLHEVVMDTVLANPLVFTDPAPSVNMTQMGASGLDFEVRCWTLSGEYETVLFGLNESIFNELKRNSISIPYNKLEVRMLTEPEILPVDETPLPPRDLSKNPPIPKQESKDVYSKLEKILAEKDKKRKEKKREKREKKKQSETQNKKNKSKNKIKISEPQDSQDTSGEEVQDK